MSRLAKLFKQFCFLSSPFRCSVYEARRMRMHNSGTFATVRQVTSVAGIVAFFVFEWLAGSL